MTSSLVLLPELLDECCIGSRPVEFWQFFRCQPAGVNMCKELEIVITCHTVVCRKADSKVWIFMFNTAKFCTYIDIPVQLFVQFTPQRLIVILSFLHLSARKLPVFSNVVRTFAQSLCAKNLVAITDNGADNVEMFLFYIIIL